jgi:hypothetical protein
MSQGTVAKSPAAPELTLDEWSALPEDEPGELVDSTRNCAAWRSSSSTPRVVTSHVLGASTGTLQKIPGCEGLTLDLDVLWAAIDNPE